METLDPGDGRGRNQFVAAVNARTATSSHDT